MTNKSSCLIRPLATLALVAAWPGHALAAAPATAQTCPDFTKGAPAPKATSQDWNLGPTGMRGWVYCDKMASTEARQVYITEVDEGSPADGKGCSGKGWKDKVKAYAGRSEAELFAGLASWSPVVRERSAIALTDQAGDPTAGLITMLGEPDRDTQCGACRALLYPGKRAAPAVASRKELLSADDLWLRINAARAPGSIGAAGKPVVPELLRMVARTPPAAEPRGIEQRYLCFVLFGKRGLLGRSLEGVDRRLLFAAVKAGRKNQDGRGPSNAALVYGDLGYEEIDPRLPPICETVREAPRTGNMFADNGRLLGLAILARHHIREALPLCLSSIEFKRWHASTRAGSVFKSLRLYGGAAKAVLRQLRELAKEIAVAPMRAANKELRNVPGLIREIENDTRAPALRPLHRQEDPGK